MAKAQAQEPSMEEILASIRRIIADEETAPKGKAAAAPPEPEPTADETISEDDLDKLFATADEPEDEAAEDEDVLDLTEELAEPESGPPLVEGMGDETDLAFADVAEMEAVVEEPAPAPVVAPPPVAAAPVVAPKPAPAPEPAPAPRAFVPEPAAIEALAAPLISQASEGMIASAFADLSMTVINRNARTLDDLVQDMLRPMLQQWLDRNLPTMVERMVRAEIERVTRGR
jgi:cell pole-organizing protein PopZ